MRYCSPISFTGSYMHFRKHEDVSAKINQIRPWFLLSCVANVGWLLCWHYGQLGLSVLVMLALLGTLVVIYVSLRWTPAVSRNGNYFFLQAAVWRVFGLDQHRQHGQYHHPIGAGKLGPRRAQRRFSAQRPVVGCHRAYVVYGFAQQGHGIHRRGYLGFVGHLSSNVRRPTIPVWWVFTWLGQELPCLRLCCFYLVYYAWPKSGS